MSSVCPLTLPLIVNVSEIDPGPPRKVSTASVEFPDAVKREIALTDGIRDLEGIPSLAVLQRDQTLVLEALEIDEGDVLDLPSVCGGVHRAATLVGEDVVAAAEITGQPRLEGAP